MHEWQYNIIVRARFRLHCVHTRNKELVLSTLKLTCTFNRRAKEWKLFVASIMTSKTTHCKYVHTRTCHTLWRSPLPRRMEATCHYKDYKNKTVFLTVHMYMYMHVRTCTCHSASIQEICKFCYSLCTHLHA